MHEPTDEFASCWRAAGQHIQLQAQEARIGWLKANLTPPFLEHLSFRLGNQVFFIRLLDVDHNLGVPGSLDGLLDIASGWNGHPCIMPMQYQGSRWSPAAAGWGLLDAGDGRAIDPPALVDDQKIEMTDWELHDFAVQIVRDHLLGSGKELMASQGNPDVDPSLWFVGDTGPEWVIVRAVRYPVAHAAPPANWQSLTQQFSRGGKVGHFASVAVANSDDTFDEPTGRTPEPLWRGHGMYVRFDGLQRGPDA